MREQSEQRDTYCTDEVAQIACNLLTDYNKLQKAVAIQNLPDPVLHSVQKIALENEDYEFCQAVKELLEHRKHDKDSSAEK